MHLTLVQLDHAQRILGIVLHIGQVIDLLATIARECGVTGSRIMGGGFGGCTINLVKSELYDAFVSTAKEKFNASYGHYPKVYDVIISDGARKLEL